MLIFFLHEQLHTYTCIYIHTYYLEIIFSYKYDKPQIKCFEINKLYKTYSIEFSYNTRSIQSLWQSPDAKGLVQVLSLLFPPSSAFIQFLILLLFFNTSSFDSYVQIHIFFYTYVLFFFTIDVNWQRNFTLILSFKLWPNLLSNSKKAVFN